jgi:hypothetical protein
MNDDIPKDPPRIGPLQIEAWQQWAEWFPSSKMYWNWQNFTLIEIAYENDIACGNYELKLALLGFCRRLSWFKKDEGPALKRAKEIMAEFETARDENRS